MADESGDMNTVGYGPSKNDGGSWDAMDGLISDLDGKAFNEYVKFLTTPSVTNFTNNERGEGEIPSIHTVGITNEERIVIIRAKAFNGIGSAREYVLTKVGKKVVFSNTGLRFELKRLGDLALYMQAVDGPWFPVMDGGVDHYVNMNYAAEIQEVLEVWTRETAV